MAIDFKMLRGRVGNPSIHESFNIGVPKPMLRALLDLVDELQGGKDGQITAKVGVMDVKIRAGKDGVLGTADDKVTIKRSSRKRLTASAQRKKAAAKKSAAKKSWWNRGGRESDCPGHGAHPHPRYRNVCHC